MLFVEDEANFPRAPDWVGICPNGADDVLEDKEFCTSCYLVLLVVFLVCGVITASYIYLKLNFKDEQQNDTQQRQHSAPPDTEERRQTVDKAESA